LLTLATFNAKTDYKKNMKLYSYKSMSSLLISSLITEIFNLAYEKCKTALLTWIPISCWCKM